MKEPVTIRTAAMEDLEVLTAIEAACFPAAEAAKEEDFRRRLAVYPDRFWLLEREGEVISFVNGLVTDEAELRDEMYEQAQLHDPSGRRCSHCCGTHSDGDTQRCRRLCREHGHAGAGA